jgi:hypothetical protein
MWDSWGKFCSRELARAAREGRRRNGQNVAFAAQLPQFGENDLSSEFPPPSPPSRRFVGEFRDGQPAVQKNQRGVIFKFAVVGPFHANELWGQNSEPRYMRRNLSALCATIARRGSLGASSIDQRWAHRRFRQG